MRRAGFLVLIIGVVIAAFVPGPAESRAYRPPNSRSLESIPDTDPLAYLGALDRLAEGDTTGALGRTSRATRLFPYHLPGVMLRYRLLLAREGADTASRWIQQHLSRTEDTRVLDALLESSGRTRKPVARLMSWAFDQGFFTRRSLLFLARRQLKRNDYSKMGPALKRGLETYSTDVDFRYLSARVRAEQGKCDRARDIVKQLIRRDAGRPELYRLQARLLWGTDPETAQYYYGRYRSLIQGSDRAPERLREGAYSCGKR